MGRIQLVYLSESGFTERYAQWLSEDLQTDCVRFVRSMSVEVGNPDDVLVIGAPVHGGELASSKAIERLVANAGDAKVVCFATGVAEPAEGLAERISKASFRNPERVAMRYLPGGFDGDRLEQRSKTLLFALRLMLKHRRAITDEQKLLLVRTSIEGDYTDRELARELASEIRQMSSF